jgi:D-alanyl-D-alanine carboxypeptidase/D-alanyl-D-alanine-endopeptidase (penicillin-binding protein 4)
MGGTSTAHALPTRAGVGDALRPASLAVRLLLFAALLLVLLALDAGLPASAAAGVRGKITATLRNSGLDGSATGVYVWDLTAAREVYAHNARTELVPASNMKLVTSAAALLDWGPSHRFATELYVPDAPVSASGVLDGDVWLRGLGDPSLSTRVYQRQILDMTTASFQSFARALKAAGIKKIRGRVVGDASWFDKLKEGPTWKDGFALECGPLSALSGNEGLNEGEPVRAPARWAAALLTAACRDAGIKVKGTPGTGVVPATARLLDRQYSAALPVLLQHMDQHSDNFFAEMLCKGLGKDFYGEGSTAAGTVANEDALHVLGVQDGTSVIRDGSGLSYDDRLTALAITQVLGAMRQQDDFDVYYDALAVGGESGTLEYRMRGTAAAGNAHAKTGTLDIAVSLSGYVESANEHLVAFSILLNGDAVGTSGWAEATEAQDTIVADLAEARLPGEPVLTATPALRNFSLSAAEPVHGVGSCLEPGVQP